MVSHDFSVQLGTIVPVQLFMDSKSIFDTIIKLYSENEKCLFLNLSVLGQPYATSEIGNVRHLSKLSFVDPLSKKMHHPFL